MMLSIAVALRSLAVLAQFTQVPVTVFDVQWAPNVGFSAIAVSADGTHQMVAQARYEAPPEANGGFYGGNLYQSSDSGANWVQLAQTDLQDQDWADVAISNDGAIRSACTRNGKVWASVDSGGTWTLAVDASAASSGDYPDGYPFSAIAMSGDGQIQTVVTSGDETTGRSMSRTTDAWTTKNEVTEYRDWTGIAISDDGQRQTASAGTAGCVPGASTCARIGGLFQSLDGGATFMARGGITQSMDFRGIAMSFTGEIQLAIVYGDGGIWKSSDYGATFAQLYPDLGVNRWTAVAMSDDGSMMTLVSERSTTPVLRGKIITSYDSGVTWTEANIPQGVPDDNTYYTGVAMSGNGLLQGVTAGAGHNGVEEGVPRQGLLLQMAVVLAPSFPPPPFPPPFPPGAVVEQDPHVSFANGGKAVSRTPLSNS